MGHGRERSGPLQYGVGGLAVSIACVVVASAKRRELLDTAVMPPIYSQGFDEIVVVGDYHENYPHFRYLHIPDMTHSTNDALVKRDIGTLATRSDWILYLSDDHTVGPEFTIQFRTYPWNADVLIPSRWTQHPTDGRIRIPMGDAEGYCAGHGGIFRRRVIQHRPWTTMPHDRIWDVLDSRIQQEAGARFVVAPQLEIEDMEPEAEPWR